ncbi:MAG: histidine triad nucleotide-binding protein [Ignavibacteria bacterium CG2_30_36_16]|nr:histidine triad nucleotide-binding protein [Ignavibacteria bacterium]OIP55859.1 MAG: histidine triad nucleotide-binding protein [Ignavibacteria bacterium CG2_30_36_16]PJB02199.1 MAG: histidine triad nucleotide-binding protein [Ignavibacteria bacterium CG_4_9_14_3_um_filter_36_18]
MSTIFSKIVNKEIKADIVYETETVLAFNDINPQAPVHVLIIPKIEIPKVTDLKGSEHAALLGDMIDAANKIAKDLGIDKDGFRLVMNCGDNGGQDVYHLHMHLLGGRKMNWPPG